MVKEGDQVSSKTHTYKIVKELNQGGFAFAYKATDESGKTVFFKQYKSPSKLVPWFKEYFNYEDELNRRLREDPVLKTASIYADEVFLGKPCNSEGALVSKHDSIFQVFPFVEGNINLDDMISKNASAFDWEKRVYASTVFAFAMRKLHDANIVHCDLKPENVQVREDPSIMMRYRPLLIDMDWSILSDKQAPWHGSQGYVGTVGYMSPEHLRGEAPQEASDVFTSAIIITQILADAHPFGSHLSADDLNDYILSGTNDFSASGIPFKGSVSDNLKNLLLKAFSPTATERPTMEQIHTELMAVCKTLGKPSAPAMPSVKPAVATPTPSPAPATPVATPAAAPAVTPPKAVTPPPVSAPKPTGPKMTRLIMRGDTGEFATRAAFRMDQKTLARASSQARFADGSNQFAVQVTDGIWSIVGNSKVANPTVLNGNEVGESPVQLKDGDVIALKGRSSGKIAMELKVQIVLE
jgi:serine/threonine protein kinase